MEAETTDTAASWTARPLAAAVLRLSLRLIPFLLVTLAAWRVHVYLGPSSSRLQAVATWAAMSVVSTIAIIGIDRWTRRLLPLSTLLKLSIVFPDAAPSRFRTALKHGTTRDLARQVEQGALDDRTPQQAAEHMLDLVAQLSRHERRTRGHAERVRAYADMIAVELDLADDERSRLHWAGLIHDIGKLEVPAEILNKPGQLTDNERAVMSGHPEAGWLLVQPLRGWLGEWSRAAHDHHEKWDGTGYPRGLSGNQISRAGRIVAVADAFDVMTSTRSYKKPVSYDEARAELARCAGTHFDPNVVRAFLSVSLTSRRRAWGPLNWIAQSPFALRVTTLANVPSAVASGALAMTVAAAAMVTPATAPSPSPTPEIAVSREVATTTTTALVGTSTTSVPTTVPTTTLAPTTIPATTTVPTTMPPTTTAPATIPPTTTAAVVASVPTTTTTTIPVSILPSTHLGGGTGSPLALTGPSTEPGLFNWDQAVDPQPGVLLTRNPNSLIELSDPSVLVWSRPVALETRLTGNLAVDLWVATAGFDPASLGVVDAGAAICQGPMTGCTTVGAGSNGFLQADYGTDFGHLIIYLGPIDVTAPAGSYLVTSITASTSSSSDLLVAYGSATYPSQLRLW